MVWRLILKTRQQVIEDALITTSRWNTFTMLFGFPCVNAMFIFVSYYIPKLGQLVSESNSPYAKTLSDFELKLQFSPTVLMILYIVACVSYTIVYFISKHQKIKSYRYNLYLLLLLSGLAYYSIFYGLQYFVLFFEVRLIYWLLFIMSIVVIMMRKTVFHSDRTMDFGRFIKVVPILFLSYFILSLFVAEFNVFIAKFIMSTILIIPPLLMIFFMRWYHTTITHCQILREVEKNQECHRLELGYSVEDWYGKTSKNREHTSS